MRSLAFVLALLLVAASVADAAAQRARRRTRDAGATVDTAGDQYRDHPRCIEVRAEPVFNGIGWNHVVIVRNGCDRAYACNVSTDVDPAPEYPVSVAPGQERAVATRNGSPASGFTPRAVCR